MKSKPASSRDFRQNCGDQFPKMMRAMFRTGIAAGLLLMCAPAFAQVRITWATDDKGSHSLTSKEVLQIPDGKTSGIKDSWFVYLTNFTNEQKYDYVRLARLLKLNDEELNRWDMIAFEINSHVNPAKGGGWESCIWLVTDQVRAAAGAFDESIGDNPVGSNPLRFKTGNITPAEYADFFKLPNANFFGPEKPGVGSVAWILVNVPDEIDINAPQLRIWVGAARFGNGRTPDPDAFGVIRR